MTSLKKPITRKSNSRACHYGPDQDRQLVVTLLPGGASDDLVQLHPLRCKGRAYSIPVAVLWTYLQKCAANKAWSERALAKKAAKAKRAEAAQWARETRRAARAVA